MIGDDALEDGMDIVDSNATDAKQIGEEINRTRDYIVQKIKAAFEAVWPVSKGGTGATTAAQARTNLGAAAASHLHTINDVLTADGSGPYGPALQVVLDGKFPVGGGTITGNVVLSSGNVYVPAASPATAGWQVCYINNDGRISRGSSSERYKKYISDFDPDSLGDIWPDFKRYQMRHGDGSWNYGYIAERMAEHEDQREFVVYVDHEGNLVPDSIDFIALLMAQNAQLHHGLDLAVQRINALEERLADN